jgi:hypothetical protein
VSRKAIISGAVAALMALIIQIDMLVAFTYASPSGPTTPSSYCFQMLKGFLIEMAGYNFLWFLLAVAARYCYVRGNWQLETQKRLSVFFMVCLWGKIYLDERLTMAPTEGCTSSVFKPYQIMNYIVAMSYSVLGIIMLYDSHRN